MAGFAVAVSGLFGVCAGSALAHGGAHRLEVTPAQVSGSVPLTVRGVEFAAGGTVELELVGGTRTMRLGRVTTDADGGFERVVALPAGLAAGPYRVRARDGDEWATSGAVSYRDIPTARTDRDGGRRDQEETLLAPIPRAEAPATRPLTTRAEEDGSVGLPSWLVFAAVGLTAVSGAGGLLRMRRRRALT